MCDEAPAGYSSRETISYSLNFYPMSKHNANKKVSHQEEGEGKKVMLYAVAVTAVILLLMYLVYISLG